MSETQSCFANISAPLNSTDLVLYLKFAYRSHFSGEKNGLEIRSLVFEIYSNSPKSFLLDTLYFHDYHGFRLRIFKQIVRKKFPINLFIVFFSCSHDSHRIIITYRNLHAILVNLYPVQGQCAMALLKS